MRILAIALMFVVSTPTLSQAQDRLLKMDEGACTAQSKPVKRCGEYFVDLGVQAADERPSPMIGFCTQTPGEGGEVIRHSVRRSLLLVKKKSRQHQPTVERLTDNKTGEFLTAVLILITPKEYERALPCLP